MFYLKALQKLMVATINTTLPVWHNLKLLIFFSSSTSEFENNCQVVIIQENV